MGKHHAPSIEIFPALAKPDGHVLSSTIPHGSAADSGHRSPPDKFHHVCLAKTNLSVPNLSKIAAGICLAIFAVPCCRRRSAAELELMCHRGTHPAPAPDPRPGSWGRPNPQPVISRPPFSLHDLPLRNFGFGRGMTRPKKTTVEDALMTPQFSSSPHSSRRFSPTLQPFVPPPQPPSSSQPISSSLQWQPKI